MRKWIVLLLFFPFFPGHAQVMERVYITTDRPYYAAGETIYCSAFCLDAKATPSPVSAVAYLELYSAEGVAATAKVGLAEGRGAGALQIPADLATGNYKLAAYTALERNLEGCDPGLGARVISVYNTRQSAKAEGNIEWADALPSPSAAQTTGPVAIVSQDGGWVLRADEAVSVSLSVFRDEGLPCYDPQDASAFLRALRGQHSFRPDHTPEYDGEILRARVTDAAGQAMPALAGTDIYLGCPGNDADIYAASLGEDGSATFYTANIFGDKEMAITLKEKPADWQIQFESPFISLQAGDMPKMVLAPSMESALTRLGFAAQVTGAFEADTLYQVLPFRQLSFTGNDRVRYRLDDFTRLQTMREIFTEYLRELRARRTDDDRTEIQVRCETRFNQIPVFQDKPSLMLLDGVPVPDHQTLLDYDPLLVKYIDVYPYEYAFGITRYAGVANFVTYRGDMPSARLGSNVKIIDFQGVSYPVAIGAASFPQGYPRVRQTLLWDPLVSLSPGAEKPVEIPLPDNPGTYRIQAEGFTADGQPVFQQVSVRIP